MCTDYRIVYSTVADGKRDKDGFKNNRDTNWATWSLPIGWPV